ncbi:MAG: hypothetical protein HC843_04275 [Sphingomonadales bacterium]|nr:hypothetical protein [Sphingomonadales bacterium]
MSGHNNRKWGINILLCAAAMTVSACIPKGSGDYRIQAAGNSTGDIRASEDQPQLVPEMKSLRLPQAGARP